MSNTFFGTDGVRGRVGIEPITPKSMVHLGWALGTVLSRHHGRGKVLIGKDTRISGYLLESSLEAGLAAAGMDIVLLGPIPTPAIAYLTQSARASAGVVISASHNPYYDNGVKFFSGEGFKLSDEFEDEIAQLMEQPMQVVEPEQLGKASRMNGAVGRYIEFCKNTISHSTHLKGLKIALDCANGAAYQSAPKVFQELGAETVVINDQPDGFNINQNCGSTHIEDLQQTVLQQKCDLGVAFDGDADRVLMVDRNGQLVNGDQLLYVLASSAYEQGDLQGGVAGTLMTNFGLEKKFSDMGIDFVRADVGDRHVMRELKERDWKIGGESSGHIICLEQTTTGDGLISALQVIEKLVQREQTLDSIVAEWQVYPQQMINVRMTDNNTVSAAEICASAAVQQSVENVQAKLADTGRILLRPSGTEPLIRVMVEGRDEDLVNNCCTQVAESVQALC